jgi:hypothetical protein
MEYALLIYGDEKAWAAQDQDQRRENRAAHGRFSTMLRERGAIRAGSELAPAAAATTLRRSDDGVSITDGPFAETAEVFGGYYVIEAADLDEAIAVARDLPEDVVEIRPLAGM